MKVIFEFDSFDDPDQGKILLSANEMYSLLQDIDQCARASIKYGEDEKDWIRALEQIRSDISCLFRLTKQEMEEIEKEEDTPVDVKNSVEKECDEDACCHRLLPSPH